LILGFWNLVFGISYNDCMVHIAPSILAADFARLGEQVLETEKGGAQRIHVDVMDGHFVPNLSIGPAVVKAIRPVTKLPLEVHLMVTDPARFIDSFFQAGADSVLVHQEVLPDPHALLQQIRGRGKKVGMVINPETPVEMLGPYLKEIDLALCMTVHPGFGGQAFLPESPQRIRRLRSMIDKTNPACELEVDGGIEPETAPLAVQAGANVLVIGTGVFASPQGPRAAVQEFIRSASK
jgi:ribulose-phosphate 3-epimerase